MVKWLNNLEEEINQHDKIHVPIILVFVTLK